MPTYELELGGLVDMHGGLDRPIQAEGYLVPADVLVTENTVGWSSRFDEEIRLPNAGFLDEFLALQRANGRSVENFVRRWGPINLVDHIQRFHHSVRPLRSARKFAACIVERPLLWRSHELQRKRYKSEPLAVYVGLAERCQDLINLAAEIYAKPSDKFWIDRYPYHCDDCDFGVRAARWKVERGLAILAQLAQIDPSLYWDNDQWRMNLWFPDVLGAIAIKTMMAVTRSTGLYTCSGCGNAYLRYLRRRPRAGEGNYCSECGRGRALQDAKRRLRANQREARRLLGRGRSIDEIAAKLNRTKQTISNWVRGEKKTRSNGGTIV
jgi:DNA-binding CsgD family transcriptional regulator